MLQVIFRDEVASPLTVAHAHLQAARPKTMAFHRMQRAPRQRSRAHGNSSNSYAKRKRKKARNDEEGFLVMTYVTTLSPTTSLSPIANHACAVTSCASGSSFSPSCVGGGTL